MAKIQWCILYKVFTRKLVKSKAPLVFEALKAYQKFPWLKAQNKARAKASSRGINWEKFTGGAMPKKTTWHKIKRQLADGTTTMAHIRAKAPH
eukprot:7868999-Karenia_brevis.AAC.1